MVSRMGLDWVEVILTSVSMSVDAMTVNATNGLEEKGIPYWKMIVISFCFGMAQFLMPCIGYFTGQTFREYVESYLPWIGFGLLLLLAIKSFIDWMKDFLAAKKQNCEEVREKRIGAGAVAIQTVATSIDALCIGFANIALSIPQVTVFFAIIGMTTFLLSFLSVLLAKQLGKVLEKWAGLYAALVFLFLAIKILLEGLLG